jgi:hypothetical protein
MSHGRDKHRSRANRAWVRQLSMQEWNPIGIGDVYECWDECDRYADKAYVMLMDGVAMVGLISDYLYEIASRHMGFGAHTELRRRCLRTAELLTAKYPEFITG